MKILLSTIGIFLFSLGILSAQSDPISKNDTIISRIEISPKIQADSLQLIIPENFKNLKTYQIDNQDFAYETDPMFKMPVAKPRYKLRMPILKPGIDYNYRMPVLKIYPK